MPEKYVKQSSVNGERPVFGQFSTDHIYLKVFPVLAISLMDVTDEYVCMVSKA